MFILSRSFILNPETTDVTIIEILMDYNGKQEGIKRKIRKLSDLPDKLQENIELPIYIAYNEMHEIYDNTIKEIFETENEYELYLDKQVALEYELYLAKQAADLQLH